MQKQKKEKQKITVSKILKGIISFLVALLLVFALATYGGLSFFAENAAEVDISEIALALKLSVALSLVVFAASLLVFRRFAPAGLFASFASFCLLNYNNLFAHMFSLEGIAPALILSFCALLFLALLYKFRKTEELTAVAGVLLLVLLAFDAYNLVPAYKIVQQKAVVMELPSEEDESVEVSGNVVLPNFYFFIFDEYGGVEQVKKVYGYDNTPFTDSLSNIGFNVSLNSYSTTGDTYTAVSNIINLDYKDHGNPQKRLLNKDAALYKLLREKGYTLQQICSQRFYAPKIVFGEGTDYAQTESGLSAEEVLIDRALFIKKKYLEIKAAEPKDPTPTAITHKKNSPVFGRDPVPILECMNYYTNSANFKDNVSTATFFYVCSPHSPFIFDENGNVLTNLKSTDGYNWNKKSLYLGQYKYITSAILASMQNIVKYDPKAIIILESDHGVRNHDSFLATDNQFKTNILNAVYYQGKKLDAIQGQTGVNTMRIVLSTAFGEDLPILTPPNNHSLY